MKNPGRAWRRRGLAAMERLTEFTVEKAAVEKPSLPNLLAMLKVPIVLLPHREVIQQELQATTRRNLLKRSPLSRTTGLLEEAEKRPPRAYTDELKSQEITRVVEALTEELDLLQCSSSGWCIRRTNGKPYPLADKGSLAKAQTRQVSVLGRIFRLKIPNTSRTINILTTANTHHKPQPPTIRPIKICRHKDKAVITEGVRPPKLLPKELLRGRTDSKSNFTNTKTTALPSSHQRRHPQRLQPKAKARSLLRPQKNYLRKHLISLLHNCKNYPEQDDLAKSPYLKSMPLFPLRPQQCEVVKLWC